MILQRLILNLLIVFFLPIIGYSQVTIGNSEVPVNGALLQLKNISGVTDGSANATKGLSLPRVNLESRSKIEGTIDGVNVGEENSHAGLMVYNLNEVHKEIKLCPGIHIWSGKEWVPVKPYQKLQIPNNIKAGPQKDLVDIRGNETNVYHTARFYSYVIDQTACEQHNAVRVIDAGVWMTQNLRTEYLPDGTKLDLFNDGFQSTDKAYHYPQAPSTFTKQSLDTNPAEWNSSMGLLYSINAVLNGKKGEAGNEGTQGICPEGWHVPSNADWDLLAEAIIAQPELYTNFLQEAQVDKTTNLGAGMRLGEQINGVLVEGESKSETYGGFAASMVGRTLIGKIPGTEKTGAIADNFMTSDNGGRGYFWTSSQVPGNTESHWLRYIGYKKPEKDAFSSGTFNSNNLLSVRCKKNEDAKENRIISAYILGNNKKLDLSVIDPNKITHLNYSFLAPTSNGDIIFPSPEDNSNLRNITALKKKNIDLKILVSLGGNKNSDHFSDAVSSPVTRQKFSQAIAQILDRYELDGIDIDWEFPKIENSDSQKDIKNFTALFKDLRADLDRIGKERNKEYLITAAVATFQSFIDRIEFDIIQNYVDYFNVMVYDIPSNDGKPARHHANLYNSQNDGYEEIDKRSVNKSIQGYIDRGVPPSKLVLGIPFYGKFYKLKAGSTKGLGDIVAQNGYYGVQGYLKMKNELIGKSNFERKWDEEAKAPYLLNTTDAIPRFVTYEDEESITEKCTYIKDNNLRGAMFWEYTFDLPESYLLNILNIELK